MANPRQRRKSRSSTHSAVKHSKKAQRNHFRKHPQIRGPKALQDAWDKTKTVRQNYAALGLLHTTNPHQSGGTEEPRPQEQQHQHHGPAREQQQGFESIGPSTAASVIPVGHGRILRDESGNVIGVELPEDDEAEEDDQDGHGQAPGAMEDWVTDLPSVPAKTDVVRELERIEGVKRVHHASNAEVAWVKELVSVHGRDVEGMVKDRKRNVWQRTAGQIRRSINKAGGFEACGAL